MSRALPKQTQLTEGILSLLGPYFCFKLTQNSTPQLSVRIWRGGRGVLRHEDGAADRPLRPGIPRLPGGGTTGRAHQLAEGEQARVDPSGDCMGSPPI